MSENVTTEETIVVPTAFDAMFTMLKAQVEEANAIGEKVKTATTTSKTAIDQIINESDDETLVSYRESVEKAQAAIKAAQEKLDAKRKAAEEHAKTLIPGVGDGFDVDAAKAEFLEKRKVITSMKTALKGLLGNDEKVLDAGLTKFNISEVIGLTRGGTTGGGTGAKKPRLASAVVDDLPVANKEGKTSFTTLAQHLKADVNELKNAAFKAAGTDDFKTIQGQEVSFSFKVGDKTHNVVLTAGDYSNNVAPKAAEADSSEA